MTHKSNNQIIFYKIKYAQQNPSYFGFFALLGLISGLFGRNCQNLAVYWTSVRLCIIKLDLVKGHGLDCVSVLFLAFVSNIILIPIGHGLGLLIILL